jgi:hypothetical protein
MFKCIREILNRGGLPLGIYALRSCSTSYSQCGEDSIVASLASRDNAPKLDLDIVCYHPITGNNTYHFYRRGWKGLCVNASDKYEKVRRGFRPQDKHTRAAIIPSNKYKMVKIVQDTGSGATSFITTTMDEKQSPNPTKGSLKPLSIADLAIWWPFTTPLAIVSSYI